jgi:Zn-finger domain-containing protein
MIWGSTLIAQINNFLDKLQVPKNSAECRRNIKKLKEYKGIMLQHGFKTPYKELLTKPSEILHENYGMQIKEISKQIKIMKQLARMKTITLNRTRAALTAHVIGQNLLGLDRSDLYKHLVFNGNYIGKLAGTGIEGYCAFQKINTD